jgi:hypothetical protein
MHPILHFVQYLVIVLLVVGIIMYFAYATTQQKPTKSYESSASSPAPSPAPAPASTATAASIMDNVQRIRTTWDFISHDTSIQEAIKKFYIRTRFIVFIPITLAVVIAMHKSYISFPQPTMTAIGIVSVFVIIIAIIYSWIRKATIGY